MSEEKKTFDKKDTNRLGNLQDTALKNLNKIREARSSKDAQLTIDAMITYAESCIILGRRQSALRFLQKADSLLEASSPSIDRYGDQLVIAQYLELLGDYSRPFEIASYALKWARGNNDMMYQILSLERLASLRQKAALYNAAIYITKQQLTLAQESSDPVVTERIPIILNQIGRLQLLCENYEKAGKYFKLALSTAKENKQIFDQVDAQLGLIQVYSACGDAFAAGELFNKSYELYKSQKKLPKSHSNLYLYVLDGHMLFFQFDVAYKLSQQFLLDEHFYMHTNLVGPMTIRLAESLIGLDRFEEAEKLLITLLEDPFQQDTYEHMDLFRTLNALIRSLEKQGRLTLASKFGQSLIAVRSIYQNTPRPPFSRGVATFIIKHQLEPIVKELRGDLTSWFVREDLRINLSNGEIYKENKKSPEVLTETECTIINYLDSLHGIVGKRDMIINQCKNVAKGDIELGRRVDAHVANARKKLKPFEVILTSQGVGYYISPSK